MKVINYLKDLCRKRSQRFVSLGQDGPNMYFIDCYSGKVYRLGRDYRTGREEIAAIMGMML